MKENEIMDIQSTITKYYYRLLEMLYYHKIEKGKLESFNKNQHGVLVIDKQSNTYNFYTYKQFESILEFSKYMLNFRDKLDKLDEERRESPNIKNNDICTYYFELYINMIGTVDRTLSNRDLIPIFSFLTGYRRDKDTYSINMY
jgi:hypothetical protein